MDYVNNRSSMVIVETDTGCPLDLDIQPGDKVRVIRAGTLESLREANGNTVPLNTGRKFIKMFPDVSVRLMQRLNPNEFWLLNALLPYVGINSGVLKHRNGTFLSRSHIVNLCGEYLSASTVDRALSGLVRHGVLAKCFVKDHKAYIMNPYIYQNGSKANSTLLALFSKTEWINDE